MSLIQSARASRIDNEATRIARDVSNIASQLEALFKRGLDFAAFMHLDPDNEFEPEDKAKYSLEFSKNASLILSVIEKLSPLQNIEQERAKSLDAAIVAINEFVAQHNIDIDTYSKQFDR